MKERLLSIFLFEQINIFEHRGDIVGIIDVILNNPIIKESFKFKSVIFLLPFLLLENSKIIDVKR